MSSDRDPIGETKIRLIELSRHEWEQKGDAIRAHMGVSGLDLPFDKRYEDLADNADLGFPSSGIVVLISEEAPFVAPAWFSCHRHHFALLPSNTISMMASSWIAFPFSRFMRAS